VSPPIHFCTRPAVWLTSRPAPSMPNQRQTGAFSFHLPVFYFLSLQCYINRQTQHNRTNILVLIQHYNMFRLSTTTIIRVATVHTKNKIGEVSPNKLGCKTVMKY